MALTYRFRSNFPFPGVSRNVEIESDGKCDGPHWKWDEEQRRNVAEPDATLAHVGFEIVAQVLAAPLRQAFREHFHQPHGDEDPSRPYRAHCPECQRLMSMLPEGDQPVAYG